MGSWSWLRARERAARRRRRRPRTTRSAALSSAPPGSCSWKTTRPATIGRAFVSNVDVPAVARARPRWKPSCSAANAAPCGVEDHDDEHDPHAACEDRLRRDVTRRIEDARGESEAGARRKRRAAEHAEERDDERCSQPAGDRGDVRRAAGVGAAGEGDGEQQQADRSRRRPRSGRGRRASRRLGGRTARAPPIPPAATACTSESGASARAPT